MMSLLNSLVCLWRLIIQLWDARPSRTSHSHVNIRLFTKQLWAADSIITRGLLGGKVTLRLHCATNSWGAGAGLQQGPGQVGWSRRCAARTRKKRTGGLARLFLWIVHLLIKSIWFSKYMEGKLSPQEINKVEAKILKISNTVPEFLFFVFCFLLRA